MRRAPLTGLRGAGGRCILQAMASLRAAVIGLGRIGSTFDDEITRGGTFFLPYCHAPAYAESPLVELVAGADLNAQQRAWFAERWGLREDQVYADYREMLQRERLDLVSVCTSARPRAGIIEDAARAGVRGIWAEKPIAVSLAETDSLLQVCKEQGTAVAVNCHRRWNALFKELKGMLDAGEFGKLQQITVHGTFGLSSNGSHMIDTMNFLAGSRVEWVFGEMESDAAAAGDDDLQGNGYLAYANGVRGFVRSMPSGAAFTSFDVIGEQARAFTGDDGMSWRLVRRVPGDVERPSMRPLSNRFRGALPVEYPFPLPNRLQASGLAIVEDLAACIAGGGTPQCSAEDAGHALEVAIALRESHRRDGQRVRLPLADRELRLVSSDTFRDHTPARLR